MEKKQETLLHCNSCKPLTTWNHHRITELWFMFHWVFVMPEPGKHFLLGIHVWKKNVLNEFFGKSWLFCKNVKRERVFSTKIADMYITMYIIIFVLFFLFSHLFVYETHCTVITEKTGELIKHKIVLLPLHRVKQSFF